MLNKDECNHEWAYFYSEVNDGKDIYHPSKEAGRICEHCEIMLMKVDGRYVDPLNHKFKCSVENGEIGGVETVSRIH